MAASIVGWAHTPFGRQEGETVESLITKVTSAAIADAGISAKDVDTVFVSLFNNGLSDQDFPGALVLQAEADLRYKPVTRVENACASGSAAVFQGLQAIAAGAKLVLVVGVEKMTSTPTKVIGDILLKASYFKEEANIPAGFAGVFGKVAGEYFERYGDQSAALARIAAKNHRNGVRNPYAQFRKDLGFDFCNTVSDSNPLVAGPLRRTDCSPVSDGAAALILAADDVAKTMKKAVAFRGGAHVTDFLPMSRRAPARLEGAEQAWSRVFAKAGVKLEDLDFVETHDCFTIAEMMQYEAMGLTPLGKGATAALEGWTEPDGKLPVNLSGGLKSKGHPIGATGVSMHVLTAMQLTGTAGDIQAPNAKLGAVFNMGGYGVANYASILEAVRS